MARRYAPIVAPLKRTFRYDGGRFCVEIDVPSWSTLHDRDILNVARYASWKLDLSRAGVTLEGMRSILVARYQPTMRGKMELCALQISGIGAPERISVEGGIKGEGVFVPPSSENFMDMIPKTEMGTSYAEGIHIKRRRAKFSPKGTYSQGEFKRKIQKTSEVAHINFEKFITPQVEAYGRYLDPALSHEGEPFGFIVFSVPSLRKKRMGFEIVSEISKGEAPTGHEEAIARHDAIISPFVERQLITIEELHRRRYAHRQPHFNNGYWDRETDEFLLVDWESAVRILGNRVQDRLEQVIDVGSVAYNAEKSLAMMMARTEDPVTSDDRKKALRREEERALRIYLGNPDLSLSRVEKNLEKLLGRKGFTNVEVMEVLLRERDGGIVIFR